jgi:hypothetical protein
MVLALFLSGYLGARITGSWDNEIGEEEYKDRLRNIHSGVYLHPGGN